MASKMQGFSTSAVFLFTLVLLVCYVELAIATVTAIPGSKSSLTEIEKSASALGLPRNWNDDDSEVEAETVVLHRLGLDDEPSNFTKTHGSDSRRNLRASRRVTRDGALNILGQAWHYVIVAQYFGRRTKCNFLLAKSSKALHAAKLYLKKGKNNFATTMAKSALSSSLVCAGSLDSKIQRKAKAYAYLAIMLTKRSIQYIQLLPKPRSKRTQGWFGHSDGNSGQPTQGPYGNPIDDCWMHDVKWGSHRQALADCVQGFATGTTGGKGGRIYTVTNNDDNPSNPQPGSLRYGVTRKEPLWIVFAHSMVFQLSVEMIIYKDKTIDGRGVKVTFQNGPCLAVQTVSNVIIHGITFYKCANRNSHVRLVTGPDDTTDGRDYLNGYGIFIYESTYVWVDHCEFARSDDTHIDVVKDTSFVTISNCKFTDQDKVILMGHVDTYIADRAMRVTVMLNYFGVDCWERMPRGRHGKFHVLNNYYPVGWHIYAIGGSAAPTFRSEGNYFIAPNDRTKKEVTKHDIAASEHEYDSWNWESIGDKFGNGAFFQNSGSGSFIPPYKYTVKPAASLPIITARAGPLTCSPYTQC